MSQSPWETNEGSFIYYTCFLLKTQTLHWCLDPGLERCATGSGKVSRVLGRAGLLASGGKDHPWNSALGFHSCPEAKSHCET